MSTASVALSGEPAWRGPEGWPNPAWAKLKPRTYDDYVAQQLHIRYSKLQGSMRTAIVAVKPRELDMADQIYDYMVNARHLLEKTPSSLIEAAAYLNLADRYIVWLYPPDCLRGETAKVLARLEHFEPVGWKRFQTEIKVWDDANAQAAGDTEFRRQKAALDQAIAAVNDAIVEDQISTHLQIRCLGNLIHGGLVLLSALWFFSPVALSEAEISTLLSGAPWVHHFVIDAWVCAMAVALFGALGGFLSALMDARRTKMTIDVYQERALLLEIKPLVGSLVALVLFILLSWKVVPAVSVQNFGSCLLVAFAAGFSEKYFLRLLPWSPASSTDTKGAKNTWRENAGHENAGHENAGRENSGTDTPADDLGLQTRDLRTGKQKH